MGKKLKCVNVPVCSLKGRRLRRPRGIRWRGRWEGGSGWGIHVNPWLIHVNVWQKPLQYCKVISLQLIKINEKKKERKKKGGEWKCTAKRIQSELLHIKSQQCLLQLPEKMTEWKSKKKKPCVNAWPQKAFGHQTAYWMRPKPLTANIQGQRVSPSDTVIIISLTHHSSPSRLIFGLCPTSRKRCGPDDLLTPSF